MSSKKPGQLNKRVAVVTGGSSGIGQSIFRKLRQQGAISVNVDIEEPTDLEFYQPGNQHFFKADVSHGENVAQVCSYINTSIARLLILVRAERRGIYEKLTDRHPEKWNRVIQINVMGPLRLKWAIVPLMLIHSDADIIIISSVLSKNPYDYGGIYVASEVALDAIIETVTLELKETVRVTSIAPGVVDTSFFTNLESGSLDTESIGYGAVSPDSIADAALYSITRPYDHVINNITIRPIREPL